MRNFARLITVACFLGAPALMAAPIPGAGVTAISGDGLVVNAAYHSHKNMKRVHKAQGKGGRM
jgi:hypothetical protein